MDTLGALSAKRQAALKRMHIMLKEPWLCETDPNCARATVEMANVSGKWTSQDLLGSDLVAEDNWAKG